MQIASQKHTDLIRAEAHRLGFDFVGFAKARRLDEAADKLEQWLHQGAHGRMQYMENHFDMRIDPTKLVEGAKTVICLAHNYFPTATQQDPDAPKIARYAYGEDYHKVLKDKMKALLQYMQDNLGNINGRCFTDSAPIMEREWANLAGLGWNGKNTLTINPKRGSYFFLAEIICDLPLLYDDPMRDYCGTCTRCIDACPTKAISPAGYFLDASKCISYLTIELRDHIPTTFADQMDGWAFGCDICQEVCPWNRFATPHTEPRFQPHAELLFTNTHEWQELTELAFGKLFAKSAVKRIKYEGLKRNIQFVKPEK